MRIGEIIPETDVQRLRKVSLYEMANLGPKETGLPFAVWVSPRDAPHDARVKVSLMPWGSHPIAIFTVRPFGFVEGKRWLSGAEEGELEKWVVLNTTALIDFWEQRIHYDSDLRARLVPLGAAPPGNYREAVAALRASAPKAIMIQWADARYHLTFDHFVPSQTKLAARFHALGFTQQVTVGKQALPTGLTLWSKG